MKTIVCIVFFVLFTSFPTHAEKKGWFSNLVDDFKSSDMDGTIKRKKVREWYNENKGKLVILDNETLGCRLVTVPDSFGEGNSEKQVCTFTAEMVNHSKQRLDGLILKVKVYNKSKKELVVENYVNLPILIYPTVKKKESVEFDNYAIGEVISQLGNNYSWNYELIAYLPSEFYRRPSSSENTNLFSYDSDSDWRGDYSWLDQ